LEEEGYYGLKLPSIYEKVGIPEISDPNQKDKSAALQTTGVYFMSNEIT